MAKDFLAELGKSYTIPNQIAIANGKDPIDMRDWCQNVNDFEVIAQQGMDIRYDGLVTYERDTETVKVCKKTVDGWEWEPVSQKFGYSENEW